MRCNQKYNTYCVFAHVAKNNVTKKGLSDPMENPFCFSTFHQRQRKMRTTGLLPRHSQNGKTKNPHTFREQRRTQNFSRAFDCGCSYFLQQKHAAVRCARSSSVSPAVLRRYKAVYPCAYSRNKAKKRFVLVQRFMPAYALCRHIIKLYKKQCGRGQALAWCECAYFLAAKTRSGALRAEWQCPAVCDMGQSVSARA